MRSGIGAMFGLFLAAAPVWGAQGPAFTVPWWSVLPFAILLLLIALLPVLAAHWWEHPVNKLLVAGVCSLPVVMGLAALEKSTHGASMALLGHSLEEYVAFLAMVGSLYIVAGGIVVAGKIDGRPLVNTLILASGAVLANLVSTVGASMLLIRPFLRANRWRKSWHLPVFFIFVVSNLGGLLLPLGDPPLFLGFLQGVDFLWTIRLWPQWLLANGMVLAIFFVWDWVLWRKGQAADPETADNLLKAQMRSGQNISLEEGPLRVAGKRNLFFLAGILIAVLLQSDQVAGRLRDLFGLALKLDHPLVGGGLMVLCALGSLAITPEKLRKANGFSWHPFGEVAILFLGLFITMGPALTLLSQNASAMAGAGPGRYYWLTGIGSSILDNAPTYMAFATVAAGSREQIALLPEVAPHILAAISTAAVFFGAMTYIGNGPNFMVQSIAQELNFPTPSFLKYIQVSVLVLLPVLLFVQWVFF